MFRTSSGSPIPDPTTEGNDSRRILQGLDWLSGYARDEIEVFVHMEHRCACEFRTGGDQEIGHRGSARVTELNRR
jgi:hypothetical protein